MSEDLQVSPPPSLLRSLYPTGLLRPNMVRAI